MPEPRRVKLDESGMPIRREDVAPETPATCDCPMLDREDWDGVESDWSDITFVKTMTNAVLGVPVGYDAVRKDLEEKARALGATVPEDAMQLNGSGKFRRPVLLEVEGVPGNARGVERPGGIAWTRLFEAPWGQLAKLARQTEEEALARYHRAPDNIWVWYLTCGVCSRERSFETLIVAHYRSAR